MVSNLSRDGLLWSCYAQDRLPFYFWKWVMHVNAWKKNCEKDFHFICLFKFKYLMTWILNFWVKYEYFIFPQLLDFLFEM